MSDPADLVNDAIRAGAKRAAASPANDLAAADAPAVAREIIAAAAPVIAHVTNNEPWYQSRVTLGSIATIVSSLFALWALLSAGVTDGQAYAPPIVAIVGASFALYGRFVASKPLGA